MHNPTEIVQAVCSRLALGDTRGAADTLRQGYPFQPTIRSTRRTTPHRIMSIFLRDGCIDRYSGQRLVNPGVLRLLSACLPDEFPAHPNWKQDATHFAYWELFPTVDHLIPIARGGQDNDENLVTTSMLRNAAKGAGTLTELGWKMHPRGDLANWDGMTRWLVERVDKDPGLVSLPERGARHRQYVLKWARASARAWRECSEGQGSPG